jgi:hypothetical protein
MVNVGLVVVVVVGLGEDFLGVLFGIGGDEEFADDAGDLLVFFGGWFAADDQVGEVLAHGFFFGVGDFDADFHKKRGMKLET